MGGAIVLLLIWLGLAVTICTNSARKRGRSGALLGRAWSGVRAVRADSALSAATCQVPGFSAGSSVTGTGARQDSDLDRLSKLHDLLRDGAISEEEFEYQKSLVLVSTLGVQPGMRHRMS